MSRCGNCQFKGNVNFTAFPPEYQCTITGRYHPEFDVCDCEVERMRKVHPESASTFTYPSTGGNIAPVSKEVQNAPEEVRESEAVVDTTELELQLNEKDEVIKKLKNQIAVLKSANKKLSAELKEVKSVKPTKVSTDEPASKED